MKDGRQQRTQTRNVGPLSLRAAVEPSSIDEENRTVDIVWTTGASVHRSSLWDGEYIEELSLDPKHVRMERLESGNTPLLDSHRSYGLDSVIGVVESARLEKGQGVATVRFAKDDEAADAAWRKVSQRICKNISVGYRTYKVERTEEKGKLPIHRAIDWEPHEISVVPIGADTEATVRETDKTNPCEFIELSEETQRMADKKTPASETSTPATAAPVAIDQAAVRAEGAKSERERSAAIQRTASALDLGDFAQRHLDDGTSADEFRDLAFDEFEKRKAPIVPDTARPVIVPGEDQRDKFQRGASNWILTRASLTSTVDAANKREGRTEDLDPGEFRGLTLVDLCRSSLELAGVSTRGMNKVDLVGKALTHRSSGAYSTTGDFSVLLENALHKVLLASYGITPDTWTRFCKTGSVSDFRAHSRYRQGTFGSLDTVLEHGEFQNKSIPDARKESITAATKGNIIGLSRQAIINDDMGAFNDLAMRFGRAAKLSIEGDVFALLALNGGLGPNMADGQPLFDDAAHANVGTSTALGVAGIEVDRVKMGSQKDDSGNDYLDLRPSILLIALGNGGEARVINDAQYDPDTANKLQRPNKVRGLYSDIVDTPRISGNRRYSFADPATAPTIEVAFLDGQQSPYMEMEEGFRVDGVSWKIRLDYAVGAVDYKGAVTNAGG